MTQTNDGCQIREPTLPLEWGSTTSKRLATFYYKMLCKRLGAKGIMNWGKVMKMLSVPVKTHTEIQIASLLMAHMNYNPTVYPFDKYVVENLPKRMYPIEMFISNYNIYISYLIYDKKIEFDDLDKLQDIVYKYAESLQIIR